MILLYLLVAFYVASYLTYPVIITFHELGHAFAYLLLTKPGKIEIFIGSYGEKNVRLKFTIGKVHFFLKPAFLFSGGGQCASDRPESNYIRKITIILAGPLFAVIAASAICVIAFNTDIHGAFKLYCFALIICTFISLIKNLIPHINPATGRGNDGYNLRSVYKMRKVYADYINSFSDIANDDNEAAKVKLLNVHKVMPRHILSIQLLASIYLNDKDYTASDYYLSKLKSMDTITFDELLNLAYAQSMISKDVESMENYRAVLNLQPDHVIALNNLGYALLMKDELEESGQVLTKAVQIDPAHAFANSNLGLVKVLAGDLSSGKSLIDKSIELDPDNAHAYVHLAVYNLRSNNAAEARLNLSKAVSMDNDIKLEQYQTMLSSLQSA